jgi:hypothetical protein
VRRYKNGLKGAVLVTLLAAGCGGPSATSTAPSGKSAVADPRGEGAMKEQMLKLQQEGKLPSGIGIPKQ